MAEGQENRDQLWQLIKDVKVAMLTTVEEDGTLHSRPMYTQQEQRPDGFWFFTSRSSPKADHIGRENNVNLNYVEPQKNVYVTVSGNARIVDDRDLARELWNPMNEVFFPDGLDDPDLVLLQVDAQRAEYWDASSGKIRQLFDMARSAITGDHEKLGENEKMDL